MAERGCEGMLINDESGEQPPGLWRDDEACRPRLSSSQTSIVPAWQDKNRAAGKSDLSGQDKKIGQRHVANGRLAACRQGGRRGDRDREPRELPDAAEHTYGNEAAQKNLIRSPWDP